MKIKCKNNSGFAVTDVAVAVLLLIIGMSLLGTLIYNTYAQIVATNNNSLATYYAVEILEKIDLMTYDDINLSSGTVRIANGEILGVQVDTGFDVTVNITDYNTIQGNEGKEDVIKIIEVILQYQDFSVPKSLTIRSLKLA